MNVAKHGFEIRPNFINEELVQEIIDEIGGLGDSYPRHGIRNAEKKLASVQRLADSTLLKNTAKKYLSGEPEIVRVIVFDKTADKNWLVTWHQDKTISVGHEVDVPNWGPWTVKDGTHHVQPDLNVLEDMITFRIHLDDANEDNGCLKVIPMSHNLGILNNEEKARVLIESQEYLCTAKSGDLLLMRPHLLHSSSKGTAPSHRRVVHIEYSSFKLPKGLGWA